MKTEFKGTKGPWNVAIVQGVCIGIECDLGDGYSQMVVNTILPDTDKQYAKEKIETLSNANLIAAAPELLEALIQIQNSISILNCPVPAEIQNKAIMSINNALNIQS